MTGIKIWETSLDYNPDHPSAPHHIWMDGRVQPPVNPASQNAAQNHRNYACVKIQIVNSNHCSIKMEYTESMVGVVEDGSPNERARL
jgi:hypothetical protein